MQILKNLTDAQVSMLAVEFGAYLKSKTLEDVGLLFMCFDNFIGTGRTINVEQYKILDNDVGLKILFCAFAAGFSSKVKNEGVVH